MSNQSNGFQIKPCEEKALAAANQRRFDLAKWSRPADRRAFTVLGATVRALQKALKPFTNNPLGTNSSVLFGLMQSTQLPNLVPQNDYRNIVDDLYDTLRVLNDAAIVGSAGPGNATDPLIARWIRIAAQAWVESGCGKAGSSVDGRFFKALNDFYGRNTDVYEVTGRQIRTALKKQDVKQN